MSAKFRNLSKSKFGSVFLIGFLVLILASFALADLSNFNIGGGGAAGTLAEVGDEHITDADMSTALERQLGIARQTNPEATYADLDGDFDPLLNLLIQERALSVFGEMNGLRISKRLIDAEIANLPGAAGLDGQVTAASYGEFLAANQLTDAEVRALIRSDISQRLLVASLGAESRVPSALAQTYASMLLETREGLLGLIPTAPIAARLNPSGQELASYYQQNESRYIVPEQRALRFARFDPDRFSDLNATRAEVDRALEGRESDFGTREIRVISQIVVPDRATADEVVARTATQSFAQAAQPAGFSAADISIGLQTRAQFRQLAGEAVAEAAFADDVEAGDLVGPVRSPFGWHVVKIDGIETEQGESEAEARAEAASEITDRKRGNALLDLVGSVEDALDEGASFDQVVERFDLDLIETPLITATGRARSDPSFSIPANVRPALEIGFELLAGDDPETVQLDGGSGYALVQVDDVVEPAASPLSEIRDRVRNDYIRDQALQRANAIGNQVLARMRDGATLADAMDATEEETGYSFPEPEETSLRRLDLARFGNDAPAPLEILFRLGEGNARLVADPEGEGVYVVELTNTTRGNALSDPALIQQTSESFLAPVAGELQQQFVNAVRREVGVKRNEGQISATRNRIIRGATGDE
ncbi:peptidyl-prolyl cis-trans isomerase [Sphingomicrobium sp. XHP0239]|uniref:peptidylprolyl isomerase n=1 Tax=Sphingomicrobium maritimum TaxID=3133972 RepID=UPI0031CCAD4D